MGIPDRVFQYALDMTRNFARVDLEAPPSLASGRGLPWSGGRLPASGSATKLLLMRAARSTGSSHGDRHVRRESQQDEAE